MIAYYLVVIWSYQLTAMPGLGIGVVTRVLLMILDGKLMIS